MGYDSIIRESGPVKVLGWKVQDVAFAKLLDRNDINIIDTIVSDLTLGGWRSDHVCKELFDQLGIEWDDTLSRDNLDPKENATHFRSYAKIVSKGIDSEAKGDLVVSKCYKLAQICFNSLTKVSPKHILVCLPKFKSDIQRENYLFLKFLICSLKGSVHQFRFVSHATNPESLNEFWDIEWDSIEGENKLEIHPALTYLIPGLVKKDLIADLESKLTINFDQLISLNNDNYLVEPGVREDISKVQKTKFDKLSFNIEHKYWQKNYCMFQGNNMFVDSKLLVPLAWKTFNNHSTDLAIKFMSRAMQCEANAVERAGITCQLQGMRISRLHFTDIVNEAYPTRSLPQQMRVFLLQAKGWGHVMLNQLDEANTLFNEAISIQKENNETQSTAESAYLKNIFALCNFRLGRIDKAMSLEKEIEKELNSSEEENSALRYVNSINMARLFMRLTDYEKAETYFNKAFETTMFCRSEGDLIFTQSSLGSVKLVQNDLKSAFDHYLQAALHWLSCEVPESINKRVTDSIIDHKLKAEFSKEELVSMALYLKLKQCLPSSFAENSKLKFNFTTTSNNLNLKHLVGEVVGAVGLFISKDKLNNSFTGDWFSRLQCLISNLIINESRIKEIESYNTVVVDSNLGTSISNSIEQLLLAGQKFDFEPNYIVDGKAVSDLKLEDLKVELGFRITTAVDSLEIKRGKYIVEFKRYLNSYICSVEETSLINMVLDNSVQIDLETNYSALRELENKRIIQFIIKDKWKKDGIKSPMREILSAN